MPWTGFDLDGTLARWGPGEEEGDNHDVRTIGAPILGMVAIAVGLLARGEDVRIVTARVGPASKAECQQVGFQSWRSWVEFQRAIIEAWCLEHLGAVVPITATKDLHMTSLYDDRAVQVVPNKGLTLQAQYEIKLADYQRAIYPHLAGRGGGNG